MVMLYLDCLLATTALFSVEELEYIFINYIDGKGLKHHKKNAIQLFYEML